VDSPPSVHNRLEAEDRKCNHKARGEGEESPPGRRSEVGYESGRGAGEGNFLPYTSYHSVEERRIGKN